MSETEEVETRSVSALKTLVDSFKILQTNLSLFISIFVLTTLPLSLLSFALSLYSHPLQLKIYSLEALALLSPTRTEARHVWEESRADLLTLLRFKALFFLPSYVISLLATITSVNSTALAFSGKRPSCQTAIAAVQASWKRPLATSIYAFAILLAYEFVPLTCSAVVGGGARARWLVAVIGAAVEVYLRAVLGLALVASVGGLRVVMDGQDWVMKIGLACLFGLLILWSYVVNTVLYCECSRSRTWQLDRVDNGLPFKFVSSQVL
ncbi:PREDICTED: uncharacterized protein LOC109115275 [Nelumbo nucifera]|uniref:Uncharacterized protein LOC109115275 n=1 Tax=Nelumbo nucifera TaxID=4432 RepID=A0A1U8Q7S7_NELNU|nr:PREDICTED: uncharacterized protein LOC109115275 [Nelumbo nucifera]